MPDGHQLPHQEMGRNHNHDNPFDQVETERSEVGSFRRNPFTPDSDRWYAWRDGWLERQRWEQERAASVVKKGKRG
jgi:hypothetical protein